MEIPEVRKLIDDAILAQNLANKESIKQDKENRKTLIINNISDVLHNDLKITAFKGREKMSKLVYESVNAQKQFHSRCPLWEDARKYINEGGDLKTVETIARVYINFFMKFVGKNNDY